MKTIFIHIGHYKTGTSAIQKYCAEHADDLAQGGLYYPKAGRAGNGTNHAALSLSLAAQHGFGPPPWYKGPRKPDEVYANFRTEIDTCGQSRILASSEEFFQLALSDNPENAIGDLKNRLSGYQVRIVLYIREPMALLKSWYNEVNKGPAGTPPFPAFFRRLDANFLSQLSVYRQFAAVFGSANMIVRSYKHTGMDHIRDFLSAVDHSNLPQGGEDLRVNQAQDLAVLELTRLAKRRAHDPKAPGLTRFGTVAELGKRITRINADFAKISALSDVALHSELTLFNLFSHLQPLLEPLVRQNCIDSEEALILRDAALGIEDSDPDLALLLMRMAAMIRPRGEYIRKKLKDYEARTTKPE